MERRIEGGRRGRRGEKRREEARRDKTRRAKERSRGGVRAARRLPLPSSSRARSLVHSLPAARYIAASRLPPQRPRSTCCVAHPHYIRTNPSLTTSHALTTYAPPHVCGSPRSLPTSHVCGSPYPLLAPSHARISTLGALVSRAWTVEYALTAVSRARTAVLTPAVPTSAIAHTHARSAKPTHRALSAAPGNGFPRDTTQDPSAQPPLPRITPAPRPRHVRPARFSPPSVFGSSPETFAAGAGLGPPGAPASRPRPRVRASIFRPQPDHCASNIPRKKRLRSRALCANVNINKKTCRA